MTTKKKKPAGEQMALFDMLDKRLAALDENVKAVGAVLGDIDKRCDEGVADVAKDIKRIADTADAALELAREVCGWWRPVKSDAKGKVTR